MLVVILSGTQQAFTAETNLNTLYQGDVMRTKSLLSILVLSAAVSSFGVHDATAAVSVQVGTPNLSFSLSDFQPPPPNVYVYQNSGRPYYVQRDHRVYMERRKPGKHYKYDKHNDDRGHGNGNGNGHGGRDKHDH
jgi:hypothetical protein